MNPCCLLLIRIRLRQRQLVDLRKQQTTLEPRLAAGRQEILHHAFPWMLLMAIAHCHKAHLDSLEKQLRRQWRQIMRHRRREGDNSAAPRPDENSFFERAGEASET